MKRSLNHHQGAATSHTRAAWMAAAAALGGLLVVGVGCTGKISAANPTGRHPRAPQAVPGGRDRPVRKGAGGTQGRLCGSGAAGQGGDPYAIPSSPPATTLVPTPRVARLSRQQWSNTVRDLLKLTDISDIDGDVSGDALIGFDNEADALFVTEQLRKELADCGGEARRQGDRRRDRAGAPRPRERADGRRR